MTSEGKNSLVSIPSVYQCGNTNLFAGSADFWISEDSEAQNAKVQVCSSADLTRADLAKTRVHANVQLLKSATWKWHILTWPLSPTDLSSTTLVANEIHFVIAFLCIFVPKRGGTLAIFMYYWMIFGIFMHYVLNICHYVLTPGQCLCSSIHTLLELWVHKRCNSILW